MPSKIFSCALSGIEAQGVEIEVDILNGLSRFTVVGLPDAAVQESKERVRSAIVNSGAIFPHQRKVVNLAPADMRKCGPSFDLPIAVGLLVASEQVCGTNDRAEDGGGALDRSIFLGELALDGHLRPVNGVLACALFAKDCGFEAIFVPSENAAEANLVRDLRVYPVEHLRQLLCHLRGEELILPVLGENYGRDHHSLGKELARPPTVAMVRGRGQAFRALAVAAAGGHHLLMNGPPGSGKTLLAQHMPLILPPLSEGEMLELTKLYSAAGLLAANEPMVIRRPFRCVHSTASIPSLIGGGGVVRPGEISLSHRGVLFLDEMPEFPRSLLETLRQPLEDRSITIARASGTFTFPSNFILVGAMNPCPCGYWGDKTTRCKCSVKERLSYQKKLSGPLLDRIDLNLNLPRLTFDEMQDKTTFDLTLLYEQVLLARLAQKERYGSPLHLNSDLGVRELEVVCELDGACVRLMKQAMEGSHLSARGYSRILKVARTLADMVGDLAIQEEHLLEALTLRLPRQTQLEDSQ